MCGSDRRWLGYGGSLLLNLHPVAMFSTVATVFLIRYADNRPSTIDANIRTPAPDPIQLSGTNQHYFKIWGLGSSMEP
jgi:hypothetical protein